VWFCNRECQVLAARQGHSGANCRPTGGARTITAVGAEVVPRVPDAAVPSTTAVDSASLAPAANACHACGKSHAKLLRCGQCRGVWFCNRECQVAAARQGHSGANCRPADGAQKPASSANLRAPFAAATRLSTAIDSEQLEQRSRHLLNEANQTQQANTRIGYLTAVEKAREAASVADLVGGAKGATCRAATDLLQSSCLLRLGNMAAAARAACSSLREARAAGNMTSLVSALSTCGNVAKQAPDEMANAERESREQERLGGSPSYGSLDLSQEGRISLPTNRAALSRLGLAYYEAAVATCDAALTAAGGRDSPAANDQRRVPVLDLEAQVRSGLGVTLHDLGERQRGLELLWQAVALLRLAVRKAAPGSDTLNSKQVLAALLCPVGGLLNRSGVEGSGNAPGSDGTADAEACLREALEICEDTDAVALKQLALRHLANMSGRPDQPVGPAEAAAFRSRLNALYPQAGRNPETSCTICLEPLEQLDGGADQDAPGDSGCGASGYTNSAVCVLKCGHRFHRGCLTTWWLTRSDRKCPNCKT